MWHSTNHGNNKQWPPDWSVSLTRVIYSFSVLVYEQQTLIISNSLLILTVSARTCSQLTIIYQ